MSSVTIRISTEVAEVITGITKEKISHREYIEGLIQNEKNVPTQAVGTSENNISLPEELSHMKEEFERLSTIVKLMAQHIFDDQDKLENALKIIASAHGECAQCKVEMECPKCGCKTADLVAEESN